MGSPLFSPAYLARLIESVDNQTISNKLAKEVFKEMVLSKKSPLEIIEEKGLKQLTSPEEIAPIVNQVVLEHSAVVKQIKEGRTNRMGFLVGQVMKTDRWKSKSKISESNGVRKN